MVSTKENKKIIIDNVHYALDDLSEGAKAQINNIQFSEEQIKQLQNELNMSKTARSGYLRALKREISLSNEPDI